MIALGSTSYPYLAIAQNFKIDYYRVLEYVSFLERRTVDNIPYTSWRIATLNAYNSEMQRRKEVMGV